MLDSDDAGCETCQQWHHLRCTGGRITVQACDRCLNSIPGTGGGGGPIIMGKKGKPADGSDISDIPKG